MAIQDIQAMYDKLYSSKRNDLLNKKNQGVADIQSQQGQVNNQYQELYNSLNKKKDDTTNQYKTLYGGLDTQQQQGKEQYYNDRNSAALSNAQKVQQLRDYMAKNNLLQSGENVDAQLRSNTDYNNNLGNIYSNEQQFNRGISDKRNQYSMQEQSIYNDIGNQMGAAEREKVQKLSDLSNRIRMFNDGFASDDQALKDSIDSQRMKDINDYNERLRQEEVQRQEAEKQRQWQAQQAAQQRAAQQAAAARSASSRSSASQQAAQQKANKEASTNAVWDELHNAISMKNGEDFLRQNRSGIINNLGAKTYNDMLDYVGKYQYTGEENRRYVAKTERMRPDTY